VCGVLSPNWISTKTKFSLLYCCGHSDRDFATASEDAHLLLPFWPNTDEMGTSPLARGLAMHGSAFIRPHDGVESAQIKTGPILSAENTATQQPGASERATQPESVWFHEAPEFMGNPVTIG
jgi:hypothetical protein